MKAFLSGVFVVSALTASAAFPKIIEVTKQINATAKEIKRNIAAVDKIHTTVNSDCFKNFMNERSLIDTNKMTNAQVINKLILTGVEISLSMYRKRLSNVHGYRISGKNTIYLNRKYHDYYGVCSVASNLHHEVSHVQGFGHDYKASKQRPYSVPYSINAAYAKCCKD